MPAINNDALVLKFAISQGKSMRHVENVKWTLEDFAKRLERSTEDDLTLAQFKERPKDWQAKRKNNGYFVGGQFKLGVRHKNLMRPRQIITFDIDEGNQRLLAALRNGTSGLGDIEYIVYSTKTHGGGAIKLRVAIPMGKLLPSELFQAISRILAESLDPSMKVVDPVSFKESQVMYWPGHCADITPIYFRHRGPLLDVDARLEQWSELGGDWRDLGKLPRSPRERVLIANQVLQSGNPLEKRGVVGAFCRTYDIHEAIAEFLSDVYEPSEIGQDGIPTRYTFLDGTSSNGFVVYDNGLKAHSHHSSDPCGDMNVNAFDLVRIHLFGHLDGVKEPNDDPRQQRSFKAIAQKLIDDPDVARELLESGYGIADEDIDAVFDAEDVADGQLAEVTSKTHEEIPDSVFEIPSKPEDENGWMQYLDVTEKGIIKSTLSNIVLILSNAPLLRGCFGFDKFAQEECLVRRLRSVRHGFDYPLPAGKRATPIEQVMLIDIRALLEAPRGKNKTGWGLKVSSRDMEDAIVTVCRKNTFHPGQDRLNALVWDSTPRLDTWLIKYLGAEDTPYTRAVGRMFLLSMVARMFKPGCKADYTLHLESVQGLEKSGVCEVLGGEWFSDHLPDLDQDDVRVSQHLRGKWLIEIPEMAAIRRAAVEKLKAFLSRPVEDYTPKYAHRQVREPRHCVFISTLNPEKAGEYLTDPTGNRRHWPVRVARIDKKALERDVDQLFAEAVRCYRAGERWWPSREFEAEFIVPQQEKRTEVDPWFDLVEDYLRAPDVDRVRLAEVAFGACHVTPDKLSGVVPRRLANAMRNAGWRRVHTAEGNFWVRDPNGGLG